MYIFEFRKKGVSIFCMSSDNQSKSSVSYRATFMGTCLSDHVIASSLFVRMQDSWHHGWLHANVSVREPSKGWFPYDHCDRYQKVELSLPLQVSIWSLRSRSREDLEQQRRTAFWYIFHRNDRHNPWRVVPMWSQRSLNFFSAIVAIAQRLVSIWSLRSLPKKLSGRCDFDRWAVST